MRGKKVGNSSDLVVILTFLPFFVTKIIVSPKSKMFIDEMKLTENVVRNFRVAKIFRENTDKITSVDFAANGETLISSSDDDSIVIYDCSGGT